jgi:uncharacterized membrane protein YuzA (DUF378 family)
VLRSQIEIDQIFNVNGVITNLQWSQLGIENLDLLHFGDKKIRLMMVMFIMMGLARLRI